MEIDAMAFDKRRQPVIEALEDRQLLSAASNAAYYRQVAEHADHVYVSTLQQVELQSQTTPLEYLAVRDDARSISDAAATTTLPTAVAQAKAVAVSLQFDRSVLDGWLGTSGWAAVESQLETNLNGLNTPQPLIDQTVADMQALARSAGVSYDEKVDLDSKAQSLQNAENNLIRYGITGTHYPTPELYFTQHLRGFARGGTVQRHDDQAKLNADISTLAATAPDRALLHRDAALLEQIGARVSTAANKQVGDAYLSAFTLGPPNAQSLAQAETGMRTAIGNNGTAATFSALNRLITDAPALFPAAGSAAANVGILVADVQAVVANGGGSSLNPFKVQIVRPAPGA
jgi:hypothetical protein